MSLHEDLKYLIPGQAEREVPRRADEPSDITDRRRELSKRLIARDLLGMFAAADLVLFRGLDVPDVAPTPVVAVGGMAFVIAFWGVPITHVVAAWHARQIHEAEARVGVDCQQLLGDAIVPDTIPRDQV